MPLRFPGSLAPCCECGQRTAILVHTESHRLQEPHSSRGPVAVLTPGHTPSGKPDFLPAASALLKVTQGFARGFSSPHYSSDQMSRGAKDPLGPDVLRTSPSPSLWGWREGSPEGWTGSAWPPLQLDVTSRNWGVLCPSQLGYPKEEALPVLLPHFTITLDDREPSFREEETPTSRSPRGSYPTTVVT